MVLRCLLLPVNSQLELLVSSLHEILKDNLLGIYLHGSLAMGCFNPSRSDIDLLAVTHADLTPRSRYALSKALLALSGNPAPVEISVIKHTDLYPWRHPCPYIFHYSENWRERFEQDLARRVALNDLREERIETESGTHCDPDLAGHITVLRARGQVLYGPPIDKVFPVVPRADFLDSILGDVLSPEFGLDSESADPVYGVLNACRTLAYLQGGEVLSKAEGGQWALTHIPAGFRQVVQAALGAYENAGKFEQVDGLEAFKGWMMQAIRTQSSI